MKGAFVVGRSSAGGVRRTILRRPRVVSRAADAGVAQMDVSGAADVAAPADESLARRCKQMSAIVAASVAVSCVSLGYALWQSAAAQSAVDQATRGSSAVWVTARDVKAGDVIDAGALEVRRVPEAYRSAAALAAEGDDALAGVSGARALVDMPAGSQLCSDFVTGTGSDGRLAGQLALGMEAVSLSVDDETGIAGLVKPYDSVRVVSTEQASSGVMDLQVLAERSRVLAVGGDGYVDGASYSAVVVEVTPDEADAIRQAQASGRVSVQLLPSEGTSAGRLDG